MTPPRQVFVYSYWLGLWAVLSVSRLLRYAPPTLSLAVAFTFNVFAAIVLPCFDVKVGIGTAAPSLRVAVVGTEAVLATVSYFSHPQNVFTHETVGRQAALLGAYVLFALYHNVNPVHFYVVYLPQLLAGVGIQRFIKGEY